VILVDTSVWIDHFRSTDPVLVAALEAGEVLMHPFILGELACGNLHRRQETLELLNNLPTAPVATGPEASVFIERGSLMGRGIGYIDVHLLASVALTGTGRLWTRDRRLAALAAELDLSFAEER
jgi:predicted nucleic acid-binding protein